MDKIALITGVSLETGLGYETAKQFVEKGYNVIITARDIEIVKTTEIYTHVTEKSLQKIANPFDNL